MEKKENHLCGFRLESTLWLDTDYFLKWFRTLELISSIPSLLVSYVLTAQIFKANVAGPELRLEDTVGNLRGNFLSITLSCQWVMSQSEMGTDLNRGMLSSGNVVL